ncbi:MAG: alpha-glucan family phosphorylase [Terriglobia bacterium]|jgi:starch phosphorylase
MIPLSTPSRVAYFSMEVALDPTMPTYSGGLGMLAGDTLRSAADLGVRMVAVSLLHRKGYFAQRLDQQGNQSESPATWNPEEKLELMKPAVSVRIEGREIKVRAWRYLVEGIGGDVLPVYLLDTNLPENSEWDRTLTDHLYGGDLHYRLCQEAVLGMGGVAILPKLGHHHISSYHLNEGHAALLVLALVCRRMTGRNIREAKPDDLLAVRHKCVFTTHTPVPAGHDQFPIDLVRQVLGEDHAVALQSLNACLDGHLNMTYLALAGSRYVNGVAMQHGEVSRHMFPSYSVRAITNGVHGLTWTSPPFRDLYDRHMPEWRRDNLYLRYAIGIPLEEILSAHALAKHALLEEVQKRTGVQLDEKVMTIGFARRAATYKRADMLFRKPEQLKGIARTVGPLQVIYGGKAHPNDDGGKDLIRRIFQAADVLKDAIKVVYVPNYDWTWAPLLSSGVDLWLNTPKRPQEASGTSGMKAALNGVPSFSILDGWWVEGCLEGFTGWSIGYGAETADNDETESSSLYAKLEMIILPMFYGRPKAYAAVMRSAIAVNGSFFNTQRMVSQYISNAYFQNGEF